MKAGFLSVPFCAFLFAAGSLMAQDQKSSTGLPGDQFSLNGALEAFKKSGSPEEFEKMLNQTDNDVNNLDLNNDGQVDYIKVIGKREKEVHLFILQVPVNERENQDIAVIELERIGEREAVIQIVGDQDIFGEELILEPVMDEDNDLSFTNSISPLSNGPSWDNEYSSGNGFFINVWGWPGVRFVYSPLYMGWVSPWSWYDYPYWWEPYQPMSWSYWNPRRVYYQRYYHMAPQPRIVFARNIYRPMRCASVIVYDRHRPAVNHYRSSHQTVRVYNNYPDYQRNASNRYNGRQPVQRNDRGYDRTYSQRDQNGYNRQYNEGRSNPGYNNQPSRQRQSPALERSAREQQPVKEFRRPSNVERTQPRINREPSMQNSSPRYNNQPSTRRPAPELRGNPTRQNPTREFNRQPQRSGSQGARENIRRKGLN